MLEIKLVSSLDKVGVEQDLLELDGEVPLYGYMGETVSFQIAYRDTALKNDESVMCRIFMKTTEGEEPEVRIRRVLCVNCRRSCNPDSNDKDYLFYDARMAPDLLRDLTPGEEFPVTGEWQSLWVDAGPGEGQAPGRCRLAFRLAKSQDDALDNVLEKASNKVPIKVSDKISGNVSGNASVKASKAAVNLGEKAAKTITGIKTTNGSESENPAEILVNTGRIMAEAVRNAAENGGREAADTAAGIPSACTESSESANAEVWVYVTIQMTEQTLPKLDIPHTEWFHYDGLVDYYGAEAFSEEFWRIFRNFLDVYVKRGGNTILTPVVTPPLDTEIGGERTTIQLVSVERKNGEYLFDFTNMERFLDICLEAGIVYFEICHLFTQWGAAAAPKVVASVDGRQERIFGWDTPSDSPEYLQFLSALLPAVKELMERRGLLNRTFFHISDEPDLHAEHYQTSQGTVRNLLKGCTILEAVTDYEYYEKGLVDIPVCATDHIEPFLEKRPPRLWCYYCCAQTREVPNRFISMASWRNRIYGVLLYWHHMDGFLHWGFNFYNSGLSKKKIDPYVTPDADNFFPAGDPFLVYPGKDGVPEESIRLMVQKEAIDDYRVLRLLESRIGREKVMELIRREAGMELSFRQYPKNKEFLLNLRAKADRMLA